MEGFSVKFRTLKYLVCGIGLTAFIFCQGCLAAAVGYGAYKYCESKTESAEKARESADLATYAKYRTDMERINCDRERSGLMPRPIMTQEEWTRSQTASKPASTPKSPATPPAPTASASSAEKTQAAMQ
jgi:hypothetical protein